MKSRTHRTTLLSQAIIHYRVESNANAGAALIKVAHQGLYRTYSNRPMPTNFRFDVELYGALGKIQYREKLAHLANIVEQYQGVPVHNNVLCWTFPLLRADFRYLPPESRSFYSKDDPFRTKMPLLLGISYIL